MAYAEAVPNSPISLHRMQDLLDAAPDMMVVVDADGVIRAVNSTACEVLGYRADELLGEPVEVLVPTAHRHQHQAHRAGYAAAPTRRAMGRTLELEVQHKDGSTTPTEISLSPVDSPQGPLTIAALRDVSQRRALQRAVEERSALLERSNRELEQFAYVASHDLQEPLRMVASYSQLLERRYRGQLDDDADEFIEYIVDGAQRMQVLINDLLAWSRVDRRGREFEQVDLDDLVGSVLRDFATRTEETGASIQVQPLGQVTGDGRQLRLVLQNLVGNALKYVADDVPPRVEISASRSDGWLELVVRDNGIGIAPEYHERIFGLFQRLHGRGRYPGTGLGLAIARKVADRHGGTLSVTSQQDQGASFCLRIPIQPSEPT